MDGTFSSEAKSVTAMVNNNDDTGNNEDVYAQAKYDDHGYLGTKLINEINNDADIKVNE